MKTKSGEEVTIKNYTTLGFEELSNMDIEDALKLSEVIEEREQLLLSEHGEAIREFNELRHYALVIEGVKGRGAPVEEKPLSMTNIYMMFDGHTKLTKIGISKNPSAREKTLQGEIPRLRITWKTTGTKSDESHLHQIFKEKRTRGEWFNLSSEDVDYIKSLNWRAAK